MSWFQSLARRVNDLGAFGLALGVAAGAGLSHSVVAGVAVVMFALMYVAMSTPTDDTDTETQPTAVTGTVTQTIRPSELDGYAIWGDLLAYARTNDLALHTVRTGYPTAFDRRLAAVPVIGRFARREVEHVAAPEPLPEGERVDVVARPATHERPVGVLEVSD